MIEEGTPGGQTPMSEWIKTISPNAAWDTLDDEKKRIFTQFRRLEDHYDELTSEGLREIMSVYPAYFNNFPMYVEWMLSDNPAYDDSTTQMEYLEEDLATISDPVQKEQTRQQSLRQHSKKFFSSSMASMKAEALDVVKEVGLNINELEEAGRKFSQQATVESATEHALAVLPVYKKMRALGYSRYDLVG